MKWLLLIIIVFGGAIYYVLKLPFTLGTGFSEEKRKAREVDYTVVEKEENKNLLK